MNRRIFKLTMQESDSIYNTFVPAVWATDIELGDVVEGREVTDVDCTHLGTCVEYDDKFKRDYPLGTLIVCDRVRVNAEFFNG